VKYLSAGALKTLIHSIPNMIRNLVNAALCLIFMASAVAQQIAGSTRNTAPETFFRYPAAFEVQLSPSGDRIAITTRRGDSRSGLVVLDLEPKGTPRWVASFNDADVVHFHWLGDDELVFSVVDLNAGSAADYEIASGLYSVHADGSGLRQLVRRHGSPFVTNGDDHKQGLDWNHIFLGTIMGHPDEIIVGRMHASGREVDEVTPFLLNVHNGRTRPLDLMSPPAHVLHWYFDESGIPYSAQTHDDGRDRLYWLDREKHVWNILADDPVGKQVITPVGLDSKGALLVSAPRGDGLWGTLLRLDLSSSPPTERELIAAPGFDIRPRPVFGGSGHQLLGVRIETDARSTVWYDPTMKALQQRVDELLPGTVNQLECRHCLAANSVVLVRSSSGSDPGRIWLFHGDKQGAQALEPVMSLMPDIEPASMGTKELVRIKARDGLEIPVWVTYPHGYKHGERGTNGPALPAVVLVHGGPWVRGVQWTWNPMSQFLAANGYLVIEPEYRGSDGYGARFMEAGFKQFGRSMQDDVTDSLRWAQKTGIASDRACIMGASYGGYAVLMGLAKDPELYRCGVEWVGLADLDLFLKGSWWVLDDYSSENRTVYLPERVGRLPEDEAIIEANNPVKLASRIRAPLLMAYGSGDKRVPMAHGERMLEALKSNGQNPEWIVYEGEGHGWRTQEHQIDFARRVQTFLAANLSPD
jgi:dipeptidyl aminopeptidase/acylaminoacyl peptidase